MEYCIAPAIVILGGLVVTWVKYRNKQRSLNGKREIGWDYYDTHGTW